MSYHFKPAKMAVIRKWVITSVGEDVEKLNPQRLWLEVSVATLQNTLAVSQNVKHEVAV